ncbi:PfkB family carbohydrate kinase [Telmatospirillum sp.]|uniref:PfkB family carbohydrate kinase n=1 Tax=Telmatospirillum sp. TaxID=2079197 RepID=UPI002849068C|nr:PfkB family carbohydrate kinase [Telmatospirillum sp.]MDR3441015.1 PfkB family carbohydrate kinase [Telmatospirillum sp.]
MKPLACVGIAVLDKLFQVDTLPSTGGKYVAHGYREIGGGPAATAACAVARLGHEVQLIARVGDDSSGTTIIEELQRYHVDTRWVRRITGASSALSAVIVDAHGERMIVNHQDPSLSRASDWMSMIDFTQYSGVLADVRWAEGAEAALDAARSAGVPTVLDAEITPNDITPLVERTDHVVFSHPGLTRLTGIADFKAGLQAAAERTNGRVYVTAGSDGCYWLESGDLQYEPSHPVSVVDTTGAGDVFHGAMLVALAEGRPIRQAVRFACLVAALKCTRVGGRDGIPDRAEVDRALAG